MREAQTDTAGDVLQDPDTGEVVYEWVRYADLWAAIEPVSGREFIQSQATQDQITARVTVRYRPEINPAMRFRHKGSIYGIVAVLPDKDSGLEYLTLMSYVASFDNDSGDDQPTETFYLTNGAGDRLTDGAGNALTWN